MAVPLADLPAVLPIPNPDEPFEGNRRVSVRHAREFAQYWSTSRRWATPPLLTDSPLDLEQWFEPRMQDGGLTAGILRLPAPDLSGVQILDGQHRVLGWSLVAARGGPDLERLRSERVTVEILERVALAEHKQYFFDIAANARGISKSLSAGFDKREPLRRAAQRVADEHPLLAGRVDPERDRASSSSMLLSLQNVVDVVTAANVGVAGWVSTTRAGTLDEENAYELAGSAFDALVDSFDALTDVAEGAISPAELRATTILGSVTMLRALVGSYHALAVREGVLHSDGDDLARRTFSLLNEHMAWPVGDLWWASRVFDSRESRAPRARRQDLVSLQSFIVTIARRIRDEHVQPSPGEPPRVAPQVPAAQQVEQSTDVPLEAAQAAHVPQLDDDDEPHERLASTWHSTDPIKAYRQQISRYPLLSAEDEVALAHAIEVGVLARERLDRGQYPDRTTRRGLEVLTQSGDRARQTFVHSNLRLVVSIATRYTGRGVPFLDLVQEGNIGLMRAVGKYDHRTGNKFSTYATWWIRQSITRALANDARTVRLPVHVVEQLDVLRRARRAFQETHGRRPTTSEIAAACEKSAHEVEQLMRVDRAPLSLDEPVRATVDDAVVSVWSDGAWHVPLAWVLVDSDPAPGPEEQAVTSALEGAVAACLEELDARSAGVLALRHGLRGSRPHTLEEIGRVYGVTRERIRQIEQGALIQLRESVAASSLRYLAT